MEMSGRMLGMHAAALAGASEPTDTLLAAARLLHAQGFDPVPFDPAGSATLRHEARWSESCPDCGTIWIGSKAGEILQIELRGDGIRTARTSLGSGVRTLLHMHTGGVFGSRALLVGTDDGYLHILDLDGARALQSMQRVHVDTWQQRHKDKPIPIGADVMHESEPGHTAGITALAHLDHIPAGRILVATRDGALALLSVEGGEMRLQRLLPASGVDAPHVSGWIQWVVRPEDEHDPITCVSRGGELIEVSRTHPQTDVKVVATAILPTAAMPWSRGILLGTTEGLAYWERGRVPGVLVVPVTRAAVLCLDRVQIPSAPEGSGAPSESREFIVMGLENGRLRVIHEALLRALVDGGEASPEARSYSVTFGSSILAVEVLQPSTANVSSSFLVAATRDHAIRIFQIARREQVQAMVDSAFRTLGERRGALAALDTWRALAALSELNEDDGNALRYLLLDLIFPALVEDPSVPRDALHAEVLAAVSGASEQVLQRVSRALAFFASGDGERILDLSVALLRSMPQRDDADRRRFVEQHLKAIHVAARGIESNGDRARLVAWTRFVRKFVLMGGTFATKAGSLRALVAANLQTQKRLDAFVYQAQLYHRRYDLSWNAQIDGDVHGLHVTDSLVIAAATDGRLWFFDRRGEPLAAEQKPAGVRLLASVVVRQTAAEVLLALSFINSASGLAELSVVTVEPDLNARRVRVRTSPVDVADARGAMVTSMCVVPYCQDTILAGLNRPEPLFALIRRHADGVTFRLETIREEPTVAPRAAQPHGDAPTRAVAVAPLWKANGEHEGEYLAIIGSDNGTVRIVWFTIPRTRTRTLAYAQFDPVRAVALEVARDARNEPLDWITCYIGTSGGEVFAGDVPRRADPDAAEPVWREAYEGSVVAVQPWHATPLYPRERVLVTVTERGKLCLYDTRLFSSVAEPEQSETNNYRFRGMRLDRVTLPEPILGIVLIPGTADFVVAGAAGRISCGAIVCTRDSAERTVADDAIGDDGWPRNLWTRLERLREDTGYGRHLFPSREPAEQQRREREIRELIHLEGGAVRRYLLRQHLVVDEPWLADVAGDEVLDETERRRRQGERIEQRARRYLHRLDPSRPEDRELIKVVLKSLGREVLDRPLHALAAAAASARSAMALRDDLARERAAAGAAVRVLHRQIAAASRLPASQAGRLRVIAFKELFRVHALRHAAHDENIQDTVRHALAECLRDDDLLVSIEALRAVGVAFRNLAVLRESLKRHDDEAARALMDHIFPGGVGDVLWLVDLLADKLKRYGGSSLQSIPSHGWYWVSALPPILRLFPESTLLICDHLTRASVPTDTLHVLAQRLHGRGTQRAAALITTLYVVPSATKRDVFITDYNRKTVETVLRKAAPDFTLDPLSAPTSDSGIAHRLIEVYDWLRRCWEIENVEEIPELPDPPSDVSGVDVAGGAGRHPSPIAQAEQLCKDLHGLIGTLRQTRSYEQRRRQIAELTERIDSDRCLDEDAEYGRLTAPVRRVVSAILESWNQQLSSGSPPDENAVVHGAMGRRYQLGAYLGEGLLGKVHEAEGPGGRVVIKVFKSRADANGKGKKSFIEGARRNLGLPAPVNAGIVQVLEILDENGRYPMYVMEHCNMGALDSYLDQPGKQDSAAINVSAIATDISEALQYAHASGLVHGDVRAGNILLHRDERNRIQYKLGDFDLALTAGSKLPERLRRPELREPEAGQWRDAAALALVLTRLLTGQILEWDSTDAVDEACRTLAEGGSDKPLRPALRGVLGDPAVPLVTNAASFFEALKPPSPRTPLLPPPATMFTGDEIREAHEAIVALRATAACLQVIPAAVAADLPAGNNSAERLLLALNHLNTFTGTDGDMLVMVLENALTLAGPHRVEAEHLERLLKIRRSPVQPMPQGAR